MARRGFIRWISLQFDKDSARRMTDEAEAWGARSGSAMAGEFEGAMKVGGQKGARALTTALQREYKLRMARLSASLADGTINERDFRREGEKAAREFNAGLTSGIKRLQTSTGGLTDAQFVGLSSRFKTASAGAGAAVAAGLGRSLVAPLAAFFTASEGLRQIRTAIEASDELANSIQKLGGTAKITGISLATLEDESAKAQQTFRLAIPVANDLTTEVAKLASKAGDIGKTSDALRAFLDIGAARGLSAAQTLQAVGQSILGIDEGTDKLFGKNPSAIQDEWAKAIGRTAESLSDQEKMQALLNETLRAGEATLGSYEERLKTTAGQAAQAAMEIRQLQAEIGTAFGPTRVLLLKIELAVVGVLADILKGWKDSKQFDEGQFDLTRGNRPATPFDLAQGPAGFGGARRPRVDLDAAAARMGLAANPLLSAEELARRAAAAKAIADKDAEARRRGAAGAQGELGDAAKRLLYGVVPGVTSNLDTGGANLGMVDTSGRTPLEKLGDDMMRVDAIAEDVAENVAGVWQDAFAQMIADGGNVGAFFDGMWRGAAAAAGAALAEFAKKHAAQEFAMAIEMAAAALGFGAFGNVPGAVAATGSVQGHLAAALAWSALAGGASAGAGAVRSRSPGSTHDTALSTARDSITSRERLGPEVNIYLSGEFDMLNPEAQRVIYGTQQLARERYGDNAKITVRRAS